MSWHADDDQVDPAFKPLVEAGQGEAEGFEEAEAELIRHATHGDEGSTRAILDDADTRDEELTDAEYGEADSEQHPDA
jgi:hypothetical protein